MKAFTVAAGKARTAMKSAVGISKTGRYGMSEGQVRSAMGVLSVAGRPSPPFNPLN